MLAVANNRKTLEKDGSPFFYLADTCWSAFTNITDQEWDYYLERRKEQGFNTLQINILPQWDASGTMLDWEPFVEGNPLKLNPAYFQHARGMAQKAKNKGFELALVVLWCNYVPDTWASALFDTSILPQESIAPYIQKVHESFTDLNPIYIISGDTDFPTSLTESYYIQAASQLRKLAPDVLMTAHLKGRYSYIPHELEKNLDLHFYQSGHNAKDLSMPYSLSEKMQNLYSLKPLINAEPCYEDMSYSGGQYGRWTRRDVRRAGWASLLSGACAGITYGAAGIYSWHQKGSDFMSGLGEGFDTPQAWQDAIHFPGAWDYGLMRQILENRVLNPRQDLLRNHTHEIRIAQDQKGELLIYLPFNTIIRLDGDFTDRSFIALDLEKRYQCKLDIFFQDGQTLISRHPFLEDVLIQSKKR